MNERMFEWLQFTLCSLLRVRVSVCLCFVPSLGLNFSNMTNRVILHREWNLIPPRWIGNLESYNRQPKYPPPPSPSIHYFTPPRLTFSPLPVLFIFTPFQRSTKARFILAHLHNHTHSHSNLAQPPPPPAPSPPLSEQGSIPTAST